jgi:osmoprotectant transport system ATP-binding protein
MIILRDVVKSYGPSMAHVGEPSSPSIALRLPELALSAGKTTALIGPSGCGKSTLLRLLIGLTRPDRGRIEIFGTSVIPAHLRGLRLRIGYVIQESGLFPHLTARDNAALQARTLGWISTRIQMRMDELAARLHFDEELLDRYPSQLSGGQRQRASLIRALMLDPEVLLLDEPLGALDPLIRHDLQEELRETFQRLRKTVVLVTHDFSEAAFLSDEIVLLRAGELEQHGSAGELLHQPATPFVTRFIQAQRASWQSLAS